MKDENCIFCKIVAGDIPCYKVYEDNQFLCFLTIKPNTKGHVVLIPKAHTEDIISVDDTISSELFKTGRKLATKMKNVFNSKRVCFLLAGLQVDHLHLQLFPLNSEKELDHNLAYDLTTEEAKEVLKLYKF